MGSFGDRLRREREQRGITLDDIALTTKIRAGLLQALEEEKFERLPGGIFNKGFVRAYARHLGLDEDQAVADYLTASGEAPVRKPGEPGGRAESPRIQLVREEPEPPVNEGVFPGARGVIAGFLVLVLVGIVAWLYYHREKRPEFLSAASSSSVQTTETQPTPETTPSPAANQPASPGAAGKPEAVATPKPAQTTSTSPAAGVPGPATNAALTGTFTVRLKADEECWMQIAADGKNEEITLDAGLEKLITARDRVTIRAGSVGALDIFFNGQKLPSQGEYGQVKTMVFSRNGLEAPPANTAAPAAAPQP